MKILGGIIAATILLSTAVLSVLGIWGITPLTGEIIWKVLASAGITIVASFLLKLLSVLFFKKEKYTKKGNNAHLIR